MGLSPTNYGGLHRNASTVRCAVEHYYPVCCRARLLQPPPSFGSSTGKSRVVRKFGVHSISGSCSDTCMLCCIFVRSEPLYAVNAMQGASISEPMPHASPLRMRPWRSSSRPASLHATAGISAMVGTELASDSEDHTPPRCVGNAHALHGAKHSGWPKGRLGIACMQTGCSPTVHAAAPPMVQQCHPKNYAAPHGSLSSHCPLLPLTAGARLLLRRMARCGHPSRLSAGEEGETVAYGFRM